MNSFACRRLVLATSLLLLGACGGAPLEEEEESSDDALRDDAPEKAAALRAKVEKCTSAPTSANELACLQAVNSTESNRMAREAETARIEDEARANQPDPGYDSKLPAYRDGAAKLCNVLAGQPADSKQAPEAVLDCLMKRERALSSLILDVVYGEAKGGPRGSGFQLACHSPTDDATRPVGWTRDQEAAAMAKWAECVVKQFSTTYRAKIAETAVFDRAVSSSVGMCEVLGSVGHVALHAIAKSTCAAKALVLLEATPLVK